MRRLIQITMATFLFLGTILMTGCGEDTVVPQNLENPKAFLPTNDQVKTDDNNQTLETIEGDKKCTEKLLENEIIVQLMPDVDPGYWSKKYINFRLEVIERIAPNMDYYLVTYDMSIVKPAVMLDVIKSDRNVIDAGFNKCLDGRG